MEKIIKSIKFINLNNNSKNKLLEDDVYFTLRDIFQNINSYDIAMEANHFNNLLTNSISYEDRTYMFCYTNVLTDKIYVKNLLEWLKKLLVLLNNSNHLKFIDDIYNKNDFITFEDCWYKIRELKKLVRYQYYNLKQT